MSGAIFLVKDPLERSSLWLKIIGLAFITICIFAYILFTLEVIEVSL